MLSPLSYQSPFQALPPSRLSAPEPLAASSVTSRITSLATSPVAPCSATAYDTHLVTPHAFLAQDLPTEVWGEIASFASRESVLNLRTTNSTLRAETDAAITTISVSGNAALRALVDSTSFNHLHTLHIAYVDNAGLTYLADRFVDRFIDRFADRFVDRSAAQSERDASAGLRIALVHGIGDLSGALIRLSALPLGALRLDNIYPIEASVMAALQYARFPIDIKGRFVDEDALVALSRIPTLRSLHTNATQFTEAVASTFTSHPALQALTLGASHNLSVRGVEHIAAIAHLQALVLEENLYIAKAISYQAALTLGAQPALHTLCIHTSSGPLSDESFDAISRNTGIKTFATAIGPSLHHVKRMTSLETLTLRGRCAETSCIDTHSAMSIASLPHLHSLSISTSDFSEGAWSALLDGSRIKTLSLYNLPALERAVAALPTATHLRELTIETDWGDLAVATMLADHPTLEKLTIDGMPYAVRSGIEH